MKYLNYKLILIGLLAFSFTACEDDSSDDSQNSSSSPSSSSETIQSSSWEITNYEDDNENKTYHFSEYRFDFSDNGEASATNGESTISGTWSFSNDSEGNLELNLDFGLQEPWDDLEDDWDVLSISDSKIDLKDISGGDGSIDLLTFEVL
ncbi:MAG: hypothetical protein PF448_10235 [Bacteroidales bacterium]|jgi:hypothetical protein|nr:hypothetical protein [Bacteroidales bacterium]